jgi:DNA-binding MarR family transcriptional regulator
MSKNKTTSTQRLHHENEAWLVFNALKKSRSINTLSFKTLLGLSLMEEVNVSDLSEVFDVTQPAISRTLDVLEKKGFMKRKRDSRDRRKVYASITKKGLEFLDRVLGSEI